MIQDDCRAIVGSHSSLGYQAPDSSEVSVLIEPAEDGPDVPMPSLTSCSGPRISSTRGCWPRRSSRRATWGPGGQRAGGRGCRESLADRPADPMSDFNAAQVDATSLALWAAGWNEVYTWVSTEARQQLTRQGGRGRAGARRRAPDAAVGRPARCPAPPCHQRRPAEFPQRGPVARNLRERRAAGAVVHVLHPEPPRSEPTLQDFAALARGPHSISVRHQRVGGRLVIAHDRVALGSFSPFDDRHGEGIGRRGHPRRRPYQAGAAGGGARRPVRGRVEDAAATGPGACPACWRRQGRRPGFPSCSRHAPCRPRNSGSSRPAAC